MEKDLPIWATIFGCVLFGAALCSNFIWYYMLIYKVQDHQAWYKNPGFWKKASPWSCVIVIVISNGIVAILQTDSRAAKFSNGACALAIVLTFKLLAHTPNYGTGTGFISNLLFTVFKVVAAVDVFGNKKTSWQAFGSMAIGTYVPVLHDLVEK